MSLGLDYRDICAKVKLERERGLVRTGIFGR